MNGSLQLSEYPFDMVRLPCGKCGRAGQYRKQTLLNTTVPIFDCLIGGRKLRSANVMGNTRCLHGSLCGFGPYDPD
jgi:hypothetical protein